jgi:hypothetical protein
MLRYNIIFITHQQPLPARKHHQRSAQQEHALRHAGKHMKMPAAHRHNI